MHLKVLGTLVALGGQEHLNVLAGGVENGRQVVRSHLVEVGYVLDLEWKSARSQEGGLVGGRSKTLAQPTKIAPAYTEICEKCVWWEPSLALTPD